ncbi:hypothetical protein PUNSTDRAFT_134627 [Punctularia strigosozonata HHB-11173 SS5]|uniref:uncharacterized protein n=1 Tax=Punctularia strigosozonata (strain HHB-11173) TaxID=741275 RepID=UPI0004417C4A|nr:uncharacterized protein PUNSTDRAFT_134627 [Punctularia strigosozonata HHB-11173 SS5]EIN08236.1 hypothetical protein PUNSTDRAFT_134627 [Punctularia strigosozonata HHB-11173 SS5]
MSAAPAPHIVLDNTLGAVYIGVVLSAVLFGVSCLQTYHYYDSFRNDPWYFKTLVAAVFISDATNQALISHTGTNYDNPVALTDLIWSLAVEVIFNGLTAFMVQGFFCFRIYRLSQRNLYITLLTVASTIGNFSVLLAYTAGALGLKNLLELPKIKALSLAINYMAAITDVIIAASMVYLLQGAKSGFKRTDTTVNKIMVFVINTGLLTSICALMSLISTLAWPKAYIYICFFFIIGRLYSNSLMAALNARSGGSFSSLSGARSGEGIVTGSFAEVTRGGRSLPLANMKPSTKGRGEGITITIDQTTDLDDRERGLLTVWYCFVQQSSHTQFSERKTEEVV